MLKHSLLPLLLSLVTYSCTPSQSQPAETIAEPTTKDYRLETVVADVDRPWGMAWLPDGSMLITEQSGELIHFKNGQKTSIAGVPEVYDEGQGGLLDIAVHPNYAENGWVYLTYSSPEGGGGAHTALLRAKIADEQLVEKEVLYKATPNTTKGQHYGSRIEFDREGFLYITIGERGERDVNPQDLSRDGGKVYRFYDDGSIPKDNPFAAVSSAKKAIYSYGHRNPQGMALHPETGEIWVHEHGPRGGDEVNIIKKGANYGWPVITYGINYSGTEITDQTHKEGMEQPLHYWVPSIAPSGMAFVTSDIYPAWKGDLMVGSLKFMYLERLDLEDGKVVDREKLATGQGRMRNVKQGPDGYLYLGVVNRGIMKIVPKS